MTRSYRKPYHHIYCYSRKLEKRCKNHANRKLRNNKEDLPDGSHYRKMDEKINWPSEGAKMYISKYERQCKLIGEWYSKAVRK